MCGRGFVRQGGRGKPRQFCSPRCKELSAALAVVENWLDQVVTAGVEPGEAKEIRSRLWRMANSLNSAGQRKGEEDGC